MLEIQRWIKFSTLNELIGLFIEKTFENEIFALWKGPTDWTPGKYSIIMRISGFRFFDVKKKKMSFCSLPYGKLNPETK